MRFFKEPVILEEALSKEGLEVKALHKQLNEKTGYNDVLDRVIRYLKKQKLIKLYPKERKIVPLTNTIDFKNSKEFNSIYSQIIEKIAEDTRTQNDSKQSFSLTDDALLNMYLQLLKGDLQIAASSKVSYQDEAQNLRILQDVKNFKESSLTQKWVKIAPVINSYANSINRKINEWIANGDSSTKNPEQPVSNPQAKEDSTKSDGEQSKDSSQEKPVSSQPNSTQDNDEAQKSDKNQNSNAPKKDNPQVEITQPEDDEYKIIPELFKLTSSNGTFYICIKDHEDMVLIGEQGKKSHKMEYSISSSTKKALKFNSEENALEAIHLVIDSHLVFDGNQLDYTDLVVKKLEKSETEKTKESDAEYKGLNSNMTEDEVKNLADSFTASLTDKLCNIKKTWGKNSDALFNQVARSLQKVNSDKGVITISELTVALYEKWWNTTKIDSTIPPESRYGIQAYYLTYIAPKDEDFSTSIIETNDYLKKSSNSHYEDIKFQVKMDILKNVLPAIKQDILVQFKGFVADEATKKSNPALTKGKVIHMEGKNENGAPVISNWKILDNNGTQLEVQVISIYKNRTSVDMSKLPVKKTSINIEDVLKSGKYYEGEYTPKTNRRVVITESLDMNNLNIFNFDDACIEIDKVEDENTKYSMLNTLNNMMTSLDVNSIDDVKILTSFDSKYDPQYYDYLEMKEYKNYMIFTFNSIDENYKVAVHFDFDKLWLVFKNDIDLNNYLSLVDSNTMER